MSTPEYEPKTATPEKPIQNAIKKMSETSLFSPRELDERKIIYPGIDDSNTLNAYRELRTNLLKKTDHKNFICMVTSIRSGAGTSHVAMNLAASIALDQNKTALVVDCNIYDPTIESYLKTPPTLGLTNFLENDTDAITDIIYPSGIPRVRIIPVGNNVINAAEHFSSEHMDSFMHSVKERYPDRFIILDTPPIGLYAESQILASICDFAILVVGYGKSNNAQTQAGIDTIGKDKLAGIVFNNQ
ncbi:polysaccharide biosynthesis protein [Psychromonas sp. psych-6C06]|uniref:polysaccharide biosynthesis protein n=1 Tax=Psychromonas sp. psych-6C06 TaxID=2058089 RepID=UPI000C3296CF|nr:polysaccharide biosynthesis protein [Psychromonas sp. psych-6C06]PKF61425.1 polysaccharide biosynthesis protein [Psychromonas sp. psych-6C06]